MKINKILVGTMCALIGSIPFVAADVRLGPMEYALVFGIPLLILVMFVIGAFFLIRWIVRKIKSKNASENINKDMGKDTVIKK